jgi:hypothetical protein
MYNKDQKRCQFVFRQETEGLMEDYGWIDPWILLYFLFFDE